VNIATQSSSHDFNIQLAFLFRDFCNFNKQFFVSRTAGDQQQRARISGQEKTFLRQHEISRFQSFVSDLSALGCSRALVGLAGIYQLGRLS
jgi:hypothetical protein